MTCGTEAPLACVVEVVVCSASTHCASVLFNTYTPGKSLFMYACLHPALHCLLFHVQTQTLPLLIRRPAQGMTRKSWTMVMMM
jgi:hypothetical protein